MRALSKIEDYTHEVGATGDRIAGDDSGSDALEELLAGDDLLAHQVAAALGLHLILDVHACYSCASILGYSTSDHGGTTEPEYASQ